MPFVSKQRLAAKMCWASRRLAQQHSVARLVPPVPPPTLTESEQEIGLNLDSPVEGLLAPVEVNIKMEPFADMEFEVELFDPKASYLPGEMLNPIGQAEKKNSHQRARCQFCLEHFRVVKERASMPRLKIEFVLGWCGWGTPEAQPVCCKKCRKMFELFYDFKRSCLAALSGPAELVAEGVANESAHEMDSKSKFRLAKTEKVQTGQPEESNTEAVQEMEPSIEEQSLPECTEGQPPSPEVLPVDLQPNTKKSKFECQICLTKFSYKAAFEKHKLKHLATTFTSSAVQEGSTVLQIPEVGSDRSTSKLDHPIIDDGHSNTAAPEPDFSTVEAKDEEQDRSHYCGSCWKWFPSKSIYTHHKLFCIKKRPEPAFLCTLCPQKFHREDDLTLHINKHNGIRTVPCRLDGCSKMFFGPRTRHAHEKFCGKDAQLICSVCGAFIKSPGLLRMHMDKHGDPKFSCGICHKAFRRKAQLEKHASSHSDERKFECKVCGKRFKSHEANRVHQRIHTQERPYPCHICGQRFMYNCMLKTHLEKGHDPVQGLNP